jgi:hypothetical protein
MVAEFKSADRMMILADRPSKKADKTSQMADTPNSQRKLAPKPFKFRGQRLVIEQLSSK